MLLSLLLLPLLSQAPATPERFASVGFQAIGVSPELTTSLENTLAVRMNETRRVRVTTPQDLSSLLGVERQRQMLGCAEQSTSCMTEIAAALGVDGLITGELSRVGATYQLTVKILSSRDAHARFQTIRRFSREEDVLSALDDVAEAAVDALAPRPQTSVAPWVLVGSGAAVLAVGAVFQGLAASDFNTLQTSTDLPALKDVKARGERNQIIGISAMAAGGVALISGLIWRATTPSSAPQLSVTIAPQGAALSLSGAF